MALKFAQALKSLNGKMSFDANTGLPEFSLGLGDIEHPELTLEEIFQYLQNASRPCIVAIDEFQQIEKYPEKNVEALLRSHIQRVNNCHFIFAGSQRHLLGMMFESEKRPFYKSADNMDLGPIARDVYVGFMVKMFYDKGKSIENDIAGQVYDLYEGHTFYVQKTLNERRGFVIGKFYYNLCKIYWIAMIYTIEKCFLTCPYGKRSFCMRLP